MSRNDLILLILVVAVIWLLLGPVWALGSLLIAAVVLLVVR